MEKHISETVCGNQILIGSTPICSTLILKLYNMDNKVTVINTLTDEYLFTGTIKECKQHIKEHDNGFLTIIP